MVRRESPRFPPPVPTAGSMATPYTSATDGCGAIDYPSTFFWFADDVILQETVVVDCGDGGGKRKMKLKIHAGQHDDNDEGTNDKRNNCESIV